MDTESEILLEDISFKISEVQLTEIRRRICKENDYGAKRMIEELTSREIEDVSRGVTGVHRGLNTWWKSVTEEEFPDKRYYEVLDMFSQNDVMRFSKMDRSPIQWMAFINSSRRITYRSKESQLRNVTVKEVRDLKLRSKLEEWKYEAELRESFEEPWIAIYDDYGRDQDDPQFRAY